MPILGFAHYNLRAPLELLDALRDFYRDVLGLTVGARPPFATHGYWLYAGERDVLHLSVARPGQDWQRGDISSFDHAAFRCTDPQGFEHKLQRLGLEYRRAEVRQTGQLQLFLRDPAGNGVELNFAFAPPTQSPAVQAGT